MSSPPFSTTGVTITAPAPSDVSAAFLADMLADEDTARETADEGTLASWMRSDPRMAAALERARLRFDRAIGMACAWGWCSNEYDPVDRVILGGFGPVECPCENLPGWRSQSPEGRAKPQVPTKATGRHGSRVQRSTKRHDLPDYDIDDFAWLPPRTTAQELT